MKISKIILYIILLSIGLGTFLYQDYINISIPYDDAYSVFMIKRSYADILRITATDVHPPLYYWGLKAYSMVVGDSLFALRTFSALGMLAVLLLGCFPVRRQFGDRVAIIFIILVIIFPVAQYLTTDIRMYSWCMFFVLACALFAYDVYVRGGAIDWIKFFATSVCCAYIHNYGLLAIFWIYILLLIFLFKANKKWVRLIVCGIVFSVIYSPWLYQLIWQVEDVVGDYWIKPLTLDDLFLHIYYFYSPKIVGLPFKYFTKIQMMIGVIFVMGVQAILVVKVLLDGLKQKEKQAYLILTSFGLFLLPILTALVISFVYVPILVPRYMTCSFGLYVLGLAMVLSRAMDLPRFKQLAIAALLLLFLSGIVRCYTSLKDYKEIGNAYADVHKFLSDDVKKEHVFVVDYNSYYILGRVELIAPGNRYCVLISKNSIPYFDPFYFEDIKQGDSNLPEFILLNDNRPEIQGVFNNYYNTLQNNFVVVDSLHATDISFYRMRAKGLVH